MQQRAQMTRGQKATASYDPEKEVGIASKYILARGNVLAWNLVINAWKSCSEWPGACHSNGIIQENSSRHALNLEEKIYNTDIRTHGASRSLTVSNQETLEDIY